MQRIASHARSVRRSRRGSVVVIVLWAVALGSIVTLSIQISSARQSNMGIEAIERVRARWAARGGVERTIAMLAYHTENPDSNDAFALYRDMADVAYSDDGDLSFGSYAIEHYVDDQVFAGPMDEHTRININRMPEDSSPLVNLNIPQDIIDAIIDWIDEDDDVTGQGAEAPYYLQSDRPYQPRNSFMRHLAELELVVGVYPEDVRDEDWNLNNRFDANEDDGSTMLPDDDANGELDVGWSKYFTATSVAGGLGASGLPRLFLPEATADEVAQRTNISIQQAEVLINFGQNPDNTMDALWLAVLTHITEDGTVLPLDGPPANDTLPLDGNGRRAVFAELTTDPPSYRLPGKININTVSDEVLYDVLQLDPTIADLIIFHRNRTPKGITSLVDLLGVSGEFTAFVMADLAAAMDSTSNVFTITSTGVSHKTDTQVQLVVVVDRSTLPVRILEYREQ